MPARPMFPSARRALLAAVVVLGVVLAGAPSVGEPQVGAPERRAVQPAPVLRPSQTEPGASVRATGRLATHLERRVVLQRKQGTTWRRVAVAHSDTSGRYRIRFAAPGATSRLRVKAPAFDRRGRHHRQLVTSTARLRVMIPVPAVPTAILDLPAQAVGAGPAPDAVVHTTNVLAGTAVTLERRTGGTWHTVATAPVDKAGVARAALPLGDLGTGTATLRAVVPGFGPTLSSAIDVRPPGEILAPADDEALDGPFGVTVQVAAGLTPTRVRVFLDGTAAPDASPVAGQPGRWSADVDPASLGVDRRHVDVVARVTTAAGSALTEPARLELLPSPGGLPTGFRVDTVASGFDLPTSFAAIDDHRTLVAEKAGVVRLAVDGVVAPTPVLDLRDVVADSLDAGLLDVVLDPDFADNGWFYLAYVLDDGGDGPFRTQRVVRYELVGDVADPGSAHVVLGAVPLATCQADETTAGCLLNWNGAHSVDDLLFDADGALLLSVGDGSPGDPSRAVVAQRLGVLAGKVLRIDPVSGLGLADNPYYEPANPGSNRSRVLAYGFRNPFRMTLSPAGDLYVGDVGEVAWEEVDKVVAGGNYGWPCIEGVDGAGTAADADECADVDALPPLVAYPHVDLEGSVTLGAFATGNAYPAPYAGRLFLGDYTQGTVWTLDPEPSGGDPVHLEDFGVPPGLGAGVAYAVGPDGTVWYADIGSGSIRRIVYDPDQSTCPSGEFLMETFRNRELAPEDDGRPWVSSCVGRPPEGPDLVAPGDPNLGDGWSMRWTGTPQLAPGTYRLTEESSGTLVVEVNGTVVADGETFQVAGTDAGESTAAVVVTLKNNPDFDDDPFFLNFDWGYRLSWERVGTAPEVTLHDVAQGGRVAGGSTLGWTVSATDAEDGPLAADRIRATLTLLHFGTSSPHRHPAGSFDGTSGSAVLDDGHAPGKIVYRLVGVATDSSGWVAESDPVYVCLVGGNVGPCG